MAGSKVIRPKPIRFEAITRRLYQAVTETVDEADKEFGKTYATWEHKPKFDKNAKAPMQPGGVLAEGETSTDDQQYAWVHDGTKGPYPIPKDGPGLLVFPSSYTRKTQPGVVGSGPRGSSGDMVFVFGQIEHPGIRKPGNWAKVIAKYEEPRFVARVRKAMAQGARESGHAI